MTKPPTDLDRQELRKILEFFFPAKSKVVQNRMKREKNGKKIFALRLTKTLVKMSTRGSRPVRPVCMLELTTHTRRDPSRDGPIHPLVEIFLSIFGQP